MGGRITTPLVSDRPIAAVACAAHGSQAEVEPCRRSGNDLEVDVVAGLPALIAFELGLGKFVAMDPVDLVEQRPNLGR